MFRSVKFCVEAGVLVEFRGRALCPEVPPRRCGCGVDGRAVVDVNEGGGDGDVGFVACEDERPLAVACDVGLLGLGVVLVDRVLLEAIFAAFGGGVVRHRADEDGVDLADLAEFAGDLGVVQSQSDTQVVFVLEDAEIVAVVDLVGAVGGELAGEVVRKDVARSPHTGGVAEGRDRDGFDRALPEDGKLRDDDFFFPAADDGKQTDQQQTADDLASGV